MEPCSHWHRHAIQQLCVSHVCVSHVCVCVYPAVCAPAASIVNERVVHTAHSLRGFVCLTRGSASTDTNCTAPPPWS